MPLQRESVSWETCSSSPDLPLKPFAFRFGHTTDVENAEDWYILIFYYSSGQKKILALAVASEYLVALQSASPVQNSQVPPTKHLRDVLIFVPMAVSRISKFDFVVSEPHRAKSYRVRPASTSPCQHAIRAAGL